MAAVMVMYVKIKTTGVTFRLKIKVISEVLKLNLIQNVPNPEYLFKNYTLQITIFLPFGKLKLTY